MSEYFSYRNLVFEPGIHGSPADIEKLENSLKNGRINSFVWNPEVSVRLQEIQPVILAIDGVRLFYNVDQDKDSERYSLPLRPIDTWISLPDRPTRISPQKKVLVIAGDQSEFGEAFGAGVKKNPMLEKSLNIFRTTEINNRAVTAETDLMFFMSVAVDAGLAVSAYATKNTITRRQLLRYAAPFAIALTTGSLFLRDQRTQSVLAAAKTENESNKTKELERAKVFGPRIILPDFIRFRTAMLILKTKDAIDVLGLPKDVSAAVLMGASHGFEAIAFLKDEKACLEEVTKYYKKLSKYLSDILQNPKSPLYDSIPFDSANAALKEYLASTMIQEITEPKLEYGPAALQYELPSVIKTKALFQSPRVLKALSF